MPNELTREMHPIVDRTSASAPPDSQIPDPVRVAIGLATQDEVAFSIACRLFVEDTTEGRLEDSVSAARLERAVARSTLDAWARGQGSAEGVAAAYAAVGNHVARARGPGSLESPGEPDWQGP